MLFSINHYGSAACEGYHTLLREDLSHEMLLFWAEVDKTRLEYIRSQFEELGFEGLDLENRSRLYLYYAMAEPAFFAPPDEQTSRQLAEERLKFLTAWT